MKERDPRDLFNEQIHAMVAGGVKHFPHPATPSPSMEQSPREAFQTESENAPKSCSHIATPVNLLQEARNCQRCPLVLSRTRVVISAQITACPIMVLADFPSPADEDAPVQSNLFEASESPLLVLSRLLDRLELGDRVHRSFAIKCAPRKGIHNNSLSQCAVLLEHEINLVDPDTILVFGNRPLVALELVAGLRLPQPTEIGTLGQAMIAGRERQIFTLPSARELEIHKEWRGSVWTFLQILKAPASHR